MTRKPFKPFLKRFKSTAFEVSRKGVLLGGAAALLCASVYVAEFHVIPGVLSHPYFKLRTVKISCDSRTVAPQELALRAGLTRGTTIWQVDADASERALREPSWVKEAHVVKRFPSQVSLSVTRRHAVAATLDEHGAFFIDADGVVFSEEGAGGNYPDLPYLTGWQHASARGERAARLRTLMDLLAGASELGITVSQVDVDEHGAYTLFPESPRIAVAFGVAPDVEESLARMNTVLAALSDTLPSIREIDLSFAGRAVVKAAQGGLPALLTAKAGLDNGPEPDLSEIVEAAGASTPRERDRG